MNSIKAWRKFHNFLLQMPNYHYFPSPLGKTQISVMIFKYNSQEYFQDSVTDSKEMYRKKATDN